MPPPPGVYAVPVDPEQSLPRSFPGGLAAEGDAASIFEGLMLATGGGAKSSPVFEGMQVHLKIETNFGRVQCTRTHVAMYTLNNSTGRRCNAHSSSEVQANFMQATCFSTAVQVGNLGNFYRGLQERWKMLPG